MYTTLGFVIFVCAFIAIPLIYQRMTYKDK
jgi:hypothetical protein